MTTIFLALGLFLLRFTIGLIVGVLFIGAIATILKALTK